MSTREIVNQYLHKTSSGDLTGALALFAEPVDWNVPGAPELPWLGRRSTRQDIEAYFPALFGHVTAEEFANDKILVDGEDAVVIGHFKDRVHATGKTFESPFALHITVQNGKITRYHFYEDSYAVAIGCEVAAPTGRRIG